MNHSIFINDFKKTLDKYKYDMRYVKFIILNYLYKNEKSQFNAILCYLVEIFGDIIETERLLEFLNTYFANYESLISLLSFQVGEYERLKRIEYIFYSLSNKGEKFILEELTSNFNIYNKDIDYLLSLFFAYVNLNNSLHDEYIFMLCYDIISNNEEYCNQIDMLLYKNEKYLDIEVSKYLISNNISDFLKSIGISKLKDLIVYSNETVITVFSHDFQKIVFNINSLKNENSLKDKIERITGVFDFPFENEKVKDIVYKRCGIGNEIMTLEAIAQEYSLTRERVRQIVANHIKKTRKLLNGLQDEIVVLFNNMVGFETNYLTRDQLIEFNIDVNVVDKLCFMCNEFGFSIHYDSLYNVMYNHNDYTISELINDVEQKIGFAVGKESVINYDSFETSVIKNNYRLVSNEKLYVKRGINIGEVVVEIVDELFPNGFRLNNDEDFNVVNITFQSKYHTECTIETKHALEADLLRYNYCYINRGIVVNRKYTPKLPPELIAEINEYLDEAENIVYYQSLYEVFKDKLLEFGIDNRYYLKGVLDKDLLPEFTHHRDYINTGSSYKTPADFIIAEINSYDGIVDLGAIRNKFPGVKDYVFLNYLSKIDGIIWIKYMKTFMLLSNTKISSELVNALITNIEYLFESLNSKVIVSSKLYARMRIMNQKLMKEIKLFDSEFAFFSLVSTVLRDKYYFRRPYISCESSINLSHNSLLVNYINTLQKFNPQIIQSYVNKMHLRYVDSYLDFLISNSDNFIQINIDTAVKKELLMLSDIILSSIRSEINFYINSFGPIDSRKYNNYSNLPRLKAGWNKYLLVGVIRTFLNEEYIIEYTDSMYNMTDFIIRRK